MLPWFLAPLILFLLAPSQRQPDPARNGFELSGLHSPAVVANSIFIDARELPAHASVRYFLDDYLCLTTTQRPYALTQRPDAAGFPLDGLWPGTYFLHAEATLADGTELRSKLITLEVVASLNERFGPALSAYANQPSAQLHTLESLLRLTANATVPLSAADLLVRQQVLAMYTNWGIDPALDSGHDQSDLLLALSPRGWSPPRARRGPLSLLFSADAPFYQAIPQRWPRVLLPSGYLRQVQLNTSQAGDGIGFGQAVAHPGDPSLLFRSQWYDVASTLRTFQFTAPSNWPQSLPWQSAGDLHMLFIDREAGQFVSSYKTSLDPATGGPSALYAPAPTALGSLGDHGGSIAAGFAELPALLQPGEATNPRQPIRHALGGSVARVWAARVYPAHSWDSDVKSSVNSCTGSGASNTGLIPYGGVLQLDPELDLTRLNLTLPALRILQAIQTYGFYVEDFGCSDLDVYTAISETELDPYGGLWGYNKNGIGVQNEIQNVITSSRLYVVVPLVKKQ